MTRMSAQVNVVCWTPEDVISTIPTEAAVPSDRVLLATHAPLRITRRGGHGGHQASEIVSEQQVLDEFLGAAPNNGVLVATIVGESGAGKSHLVRWVNATIPRTPRRHVVYLQKTETSLKDVVEALLVDQRDPEFEELRRKVSSLGSGMTLDEMEHKLLAELAEALRTAEADSAYGKALVGENGLRLFFTDPLFEQHLLRDGSFIRRRAEHALRGRDADEGDVPLEFTAAELPTDIGDYANVQEAAAATQRLFRRLIAQPAMQTEAVRLINENLDIAVMKAASLAVGDVGQAFKKIREKLVGDEIILLVEDVALIQGVRRDLLDAMIEVGVVRGVERYATVRTMMAVTPGYYRESLPETFRRRSEATSPIYAVDVELDGSSEGEDDLVDFVGRYLNAARVGKTKLEAESNAPNACFSCQFQATCHETFGTSRQGYGLYPYNRPAVLRAIRACAEKDPGLDHAYFNPRKVLSRAVRNVLADNVSTIRNGEFPPSNFLAEESAEMRLPRLPIHIREQIEGSLADEQAGRLEALVTFWGSVGTQPISDAILEAFSHPPVLPSVYAPAEADRPGGEEPTSRPNRSVDGLPRSVQSKLDFVDAWSEGKPLPQSLANELRAVIREALLARIDWFDPVTKEPDAATITRAVQVGARTVSIEGASENLALGAAPLIRLERSARMAVTFKGLVMMMEGFPERAGDALPRLDGLVAPAVSAAKARIVTELGVSEGELVGATASLIRGALACGIVSPKSDLDRVSMSLWSETIRRGDVDSRSVEWTSAYQAYVESRAAVIERLLGGVGAAQGTGAVHAIDFTRFAAIGRKAEKLALGDSEYDVPDWCRESEQKLKALTRLGSRQLAHWQSLLDRVRIHLPHGSFTDTIDAITAAVRDGQTEGLVMVNDLAGLTARNDAARALDSKSVGEVEKLLATASSASGLNLTRLVGTNAGADLQAIADYLEFSARWVAAGLRQAENSGGTAADVDEMLESVLADWFEITGGEGSE